MTDASRVEMLALDVLRNDSRSSFCNSGQPESQSQSQSPRRLISPGPTVGRLFAIHGRFNNPQWEPT
jgi:hypothetical protein